MISKCPYCQGDLQYTAKQSAKIQQALKGLKPGKTLNLPCQHCKKTIPVDSSGNAVGVVEQDAAKQVKTSVHEKSAGTASKATPPNPPDLAWLKSGAISDEEKVRDVPMALVLNTDTEAMEKIKGAMESLGYRTLTAESAEDAIEQTRVVNFACIVFHTDFEPGGLDQSVFHQFMRDMLMRQRRYIFYILLGSEFHSLYDMEALAYSANLVVGEQDLEYFDIILHKAIPNYEALFGPFLEELDG